MPKVLSGTFAIELNYVVYATPEKVFDSITKEAEINQWCEGGGKFEPFVKGNFEMFGGWVKGQVLKFNRIKRELEYSWKPSEWSKKAEPSVVEFSFKKHPAGTEVSITHSGFPSQEESEKHRSGWVDHFFEPLNDHLIK